MSTAAILVRLAEGAHPLVLAAYRTGVMSLLLLPAWWLTRKPGQAVEVRDRLMNAAAGVLLALHFWTWFHSLGHTTVMRATLLVCITPIWTGLAELLVLRQPPDRRYWLGIVVALPGVVLLGVGEGSGGKGPEPSLYGDAMAALGGLLAAIYLVVGRAVRPRVPFAPYAATVYLASTLTLLPLLVGLDISLSGFPEATWLAILGLILGPQLIGHNGFNYVVRYLPASTVSAAVLLEPIGAAILAAFLFAEIPGGLELIGGAVVIGGVAVATLR